MVGLELGRVICVHSKLYKGIKKLELIINNPYRVLGIQSTASRKEQVKRVNDLAMLAEMGKSKAYPLDLSDIFPINRSPENIKEAERKLENDESKLLYSCFWFLTHDSVDELALECLSKGDIDKAYVIWSQQIEKSESPKFSWKLNRSVVSFFRMRSYGFDSEILANILEDIGYVIDDHFDELKNKIWGSNPPKVNNLQIWKKVVDNLLNYIDSLLDSPYGQYKLEVVNEFWSFPQEAKDYLEAKLFTPCIELIEEKVQYSENVLSQKKTQDFKKNINALKQLETLIHELAEYSENYKVQSIINEYAEELRKCSIFAYNEMDDVNVAKELIEYAIELPMSSQVKDDIEKNRIQLKNVIQERENENLYATILSKLKVEITSLADAEQSVAFYKRELAKFQDKDEAYIQISSLCVNVVLGYLIDVFNQVREDFSKNKDFNKLYTVAKKVKDITHSLKKFTVEPEIAERLDKNWRVINSEYDDIAELKRKIDNGEFKLNAQSNDEVVAGTLGRMAEAWGWNANFLRLIYGIGALVTYIWPAVILYVILCFVFPKKG